MTEILLIVVIVLGIFILPRMMAKNPKERFQSVAELLVALGPE